MLLFFIIDGTPVFLKSILGFRVKMLSDVSLEDACSFPIFLL